MKDFPFTIAIIAVCLLALATINKTNKQNQTNMGDQYTNLIHPSPIYASRDAPAPNYNINIQDGSGLLVTYNPQSVTQTHVKICVTITGRESNGWVCPCRPWVQALPHVNEYACTELAVTSNHTYSITPSNNSAISYWTNQYHCSSDICTIMDVALHYSTNGISYTFDTQQSFEEGTDYGDY